jgi:hypothetical protein
VKKQNLDFLGTDAILEMVERPRMMNLSQNVNTFPFPMNFEATIGGKLPIPFNIA